jgi:hypothetical protein
VRRITGMEFWSKLGTNLVLGLIADHNQVQKFYPVLAKIYAKIAKLAALDRKLHDLIELQLAKEDAK